MDTLCQDYRPCWGQVTICICRVHFPKLRQLIAYSKPEHGSSYNHIKWGPRIPSSRTGMCIIYKIAPTNPTYKPIPVKIHLHLHWLTPFLSLPSPFAEVSGCPAATMAAGVWATKAPERMEEMMDKTAQSNSFLGRGSLRVFCFIFLETTASTATKEVAIFGWSSYRQATYRGSYQNVIRWFQRTNRHNSKSKSALWKRHSFAVNTAQLIHCRDQLVYTYTTQGWDGLCLCFDDWNFNKSVTWLTLAFNTSLHLLTHARSTARSIQLPWIEFDEVSALSSNS